MDNLNIIDNKDKKKQLLHLGLYMLVIIASFYACEISRVIAPPIFKTLYYGNLVVFFEYIIRSSLYLIIVVLGFSYSKNHFKLRNIRDSKERIPLKRVILLYTIVIGVIFLITACLHFKVKIVYDLGENIIGATLLINIMKIVCGIVRMSIVVLLIRHFQEFIELLIDKKWVTYVPFGGLFVMIAIGIFVLCISGISLVNVVLFLLYIVYGEIYLLSYRIYPTSYVCCFLIQLL